MDNFFFLLICPASFQLFLLFLVFPSSVGSFLLPIPCTTIELCSVLGEITLLPCSYHISL